MSDQTAVISGNAFDKYRSANPVHRFLMRHFIQGLSNAISASQCTSILEVGCGPGDLAGALLRDKTGVSYTGIDISAEEIVAAAKRYPARIFRVADAYALPFPDNAFDVVMACEVLEHLEHPELAMREMQRVSRRLMLVSVPWEPWWRVLNVLRGAYLSNWGNTPGHLQHFSRKSIRSLVSRHGTVVLEKHPLPWTVLLAEKRR